MTVSELKKLKSGLVEITKKSGLSSMGEILSGLRVLFGNIAHMEDGVPANAAVALSTD